MLQAYLNREALLNAGASVSQRWGGSGDNRRQHDVLTINEVEVADYGNGKITIYLDDLLTDVPKVLREFVEEVSYYDNFGEGLSPRRRLGHYRLMSASASLEEISSNRDRHYHVKLRAKNISDLRELYQLIRLGQIWPALDYESEQVPPPFRHLRDLIGEMYKLIRRDIRERIYRIRERIA